MESALAITNGLISFYMAAPIRNIDISVTAPHDPYITSPARSRVCPYPPSLDSEAEASESHHRLHVHAEVQLALFYASYPNKKAFQKLIGLSHHTCYACDMFLLLQIEDLALNTRGTVAPPIRFLYFGARCRVYNNWLFLTLPQSEELSEQDKNSLRIG
ncbi:hypothetical protein M422DRAFT_67111 [Sphaerobolus stellatus SS14]|uniref:Uncharacterized protein n=1 Tax=Sphaerobolus stellatus (strain SS14) TaxID=990650 RepID=A0A0C9US20_SPHS4|nr:hypothetical protein M422DRAFT_67111 [Sphaerobolus stellatus SS14]